MAHIILASHGGLAAGLLDSLHMVCGGAADGIEVYSLQPGQNPNDFYEQLRARIEGSDEQFIIMCDIKGGSVHTALFRLTDLENVVLLSGVTMGMALEVALTGRDGLDAATVDRLVAAAREGITATIGGAPVDDSDDEEF